MALLTWNVRWLNSTLMQNEVKEVKKTKNLDIVALLETKIK